MKDLNDIKKLVEGLESAIKEYGSGINLEASTQSVSQDALRAGFQTSCASGIAKLFKVDDVTVEQCKNFIPRHMDDLAKRASSLRDDWKEYCNLFGEKYRNRKLENFDKWARNHPARFWQFAEKRKRASERNALVNKVMPKPTMEIIVPMEFGNIDIPNGTIISGITVKVFYPDFYKNEDIKENATDWDPLVKTYEVVTTAKRGVVVYEMYNTYSKSYIPDEVVAVVKEAMGIGLKCIQVAYPAINDGKVPDRDPIIVGYLERNYTDNQGRIQTIQDMYMLAWFGYDAKNPMACNI